MKISKIEFILENCEFLNIDFKNVENIIIDKIYKRICTRGNKLVNEYVANDFFIHIINTRKIDIDPNNQSQLEKNMIKLVGRNHVTQINLIYDNGRIEHYWLPWANVEKDYNDWQDAVLSYNKGELFLKVNSSKDLDKDYIDLMYSHRR